MSYKNDTRTHQAIAYGVDVKKRFGFMASPSTISYNKTIEQLIKANEINKNELPKYINAIQNTHIERKIDRIYREMANYLKSNGKFMGSGKERGLDIRYDFFLYNGKLYAVIYDNKAGTIIIREINDDNFDDFFSASNELVTNVINYIVDNTDPQKIKDEFANEFEDIESVSDRDLKDFYADYLYNEKSDYDIYREFKKVVNNNGER